MKEIDVNFRDAKYPIYITNNFDSINTYMDEHKIDDKVLIVTDDRVGSLYENELTKRIRDKKVFIYRMKPGETGKNLETIISIYEACVKNNLNRSCAIMALGGGVVGDTAGFAASTYMRGIKLIQVPTTIISDVDSSVGGKVGVNYKGIKNLIGSFYHPEFIFINTSVLKTLDKRHIVSGIAEIIKYALLFDKSFYAYLNESAYGLLNLESDKLNYIIKKCITMKVQAVQNDIKDNNQRQLLNFGHTVGHAIETICSYSIYHGEAVALGMMFECVLSYICGILPQKDMLDIFKLINKYGLVRYFDFGNIKQILDVCRHDKKIDRGSMRFILLDTIGSASIVSDIKEEKIILALEFMKKHIDEFNNNKAR